jgi:hypothetical protein
MSFCIVCVLVFGWCRPGLNWTHEQGSVDMFDHMVDEIGLDFDTSEMKVIKGMILRDDEYVHVFPLFPPVHRPLSLLIPRHPSSHGVAALSSHPTGGSCSTSSRTRGTASMWTNSIISRATATTWG